jgi:hypothetical protein
VHNNSSDSGEIESADDDSCFEPTDGADDEADNNDNDDDDDPLASPEEARCGARKASRDAVPRKAQ